LTKAISSVILGGMKTKEFHFRLSGGELKRIQKAAVGYKSTAAFLLLVVRDHSRYGKVIDQAAQLERLGLKKSAVGQAMLGSLQSLKRSIATGGA